jgi:hypothetical protein
MLSQRRMSGVRVVVRAARPDEECPAGWPVDSWDGDPSARRPLPLPEPVPGDGEQLYEVSAAGINDADTHQAVA